MPKPRSPRSRTPANSRSRAHRAPPPPDLDDADELAQDEQLTLFLRRPPLGAERVVVLAHTSSGERIVEDRTLAEARSAPVQIANHTLARCERWAKTERRETRFRVEWRAGDRVLASHQWQAGEGGDPTALDGTAESIISQMQRHVESRDHVHLDNLAEQNAAWRDLVNEYRAEVKALRVENHELRDRLRKADDVEAEIALVTATEELKNKGRTADILEHRALPLLQALAVKHLQQQSGAAPAAAQGGDTPKQ